MKTDLYRSNHAKEYIYYTKIAYTIEIYICMWWLCNFQFVWSFWSFLLFAMVFFWFEEKRKSCEPIFFRILVSKSQYYINKNQDKCYRSHTKVHVQNNVYTIKRRKNIESIPFPYILIDRIRIRNRIQLNSTQTIAITHKLNQHQAATVSYFFYFYFIFTLFFCVGLEFVEFGFTFFASSFVVSTSIINGILFK